MTAIPIGILIAMRGESGLQDAMREVPPQIIVFCAPELGGEECFQVYFISQFIILFMIIPLAIPATISSYSIVGEKTNRSLEPLLATPITTAQLLIAKGLAAAVPAILAAYVAFGVYTMSAWVLIRNPHVLAAVMDLRWILAVFIIGPLMALLAVSASIMVSSRVNDPRVAEQISMVVIVPVIVLFIGQMTGWFVINRQIILLALVCVIILDVIMGYLAVQLFQRETILTRWK